MSDEVQRRIGDHETRITLLEQHREAHAKMIDDLESTQRTILERLGDAATHDDIISLHTKIDTSINTLLRDALNAVPHKMALIWTSIIAIVSILALVSHVKF